MYAGSTVEDDILTEKNYSLTNPLFPRAIVDVFHERIEKALGNPDMGALNLKYPIYPTCEQPMLDEFEGGCVPSDSKYRIAIFQSHKNRSSDNNSGFSIFVHIVVIKKCILVSKLFYIKKSAKSSG